MQAQQDQDELYTSKTTVENLEVLNKDLAAQLSNIERLYEEEKRFNKNLKAQIENNKVLNKQVNCQ